MLRFFRSPAPCLAHVPSHPSLAHVPSHLSLAHVPSHPSLAHVPSRSRWAQVFSTMQQFRSSVSRLEVTAAPRASATHDPRERERESDSLSLSLSPSLPRRAESERYAHRQRVRAGFGCALLAAAVFGQHARFSPPPRLSGRSAGSAGSGLYLPTFSAHTQAARAA